MAVRLRIPLRCVRRPQTFIVPVPVEPALINRDRESLGGRLAIGVRHPHLALCAGTSKPQSRHDGERPGAFSSKTRRPAGAT
ncbi:hypothetical protein BDK92_4454 [Micromonospora pisi]|uniref:Uncharacterized protein n=1 Tax=Micromonospora pisi TaxID=589240 RepID=A0A495JM48_9ACTN|nr:hypothetical protein BDK92_4454 [Micromonospora pisi]